MASGFSGAKHSIENRLAVEYESVDLAAQPDMFVDAELEPAHNDPSPPSAADLLD